MYPIRCPDCGQINHRDDLTFPYCGQCHQDLVRCTFCRHHEGSGCRHPRAYVHFTPDGEAAKHCPEFSAHTEVRGSRMMLKLPAPLWVSLLLLLVLTGLAAAAWFIDPIGRYFRGSPLRVQTTMPQQVEVDEPFIVKLAIQNLLDRPSTRVYVEIGSDFLSAVDWEVPYPHPERLESYQNRLLLEYEPLSPNSERVLQLPFIARHGGTAVFTAAIYAPSNQLIRRITVPIQVGGQPLSGPTQGGIQ